MKTQKIKISGKVQGVYFRASAKQKALNLGLQGYVKNNQDGSVLMEVEGNDEAIGEMVNWCRQGPALARVSEIRVEPLQPQNFTGFRIER
jgi:acylphosphatase